MSASLFRRSPAVLALAIGLFLTLLQLGSVLWFQEGPVTGQSYRNLFRWDSVWYASIAQDGYRAAKDPYLGHPARTLDTMGELSNGGFFPGYPLVGGLVARLLPVPIDVALLLAAQLATVGLWAYLLLLLDRWKVRPMIRGLVVITLFSYLTSFFLVSAYSESTFLFALLGYLYWSGKDGRAAFVLAALHGILLTSTRLLGLPLVLLPFLKSWLDDDQPAFAVSAARVVRHSNMLGLAALSLLGIVGVFAWSQLAFGRWDYYFFIQSRGWGVRADYLYPLSHAADLLFPTSRDGWQNPVALNRLATAGGLWSLIVLTVTDVFLSWKYDGVRSPVRAMLLVAAWILVYLSVAGLAGKGLQSMSRYMMIVFVLIALTAAHLSTSLPVRRPWARRTLVALLLAGCAWSFWLQIKLGAAFTAGQWVA